MEITQFQLTLGGLATFLTIIGTSLSIYYGLIKPEMRKAQRDGQELALWRQSVNHRFDTNDRRLAWNEGSNEKIFMALEGINARVGEVLARLVKLETLGQMDTRDRH